MNYSYSDDDGTRHCTDGSTYNPHSCDSLQSKYEVAKSEADALHAVWENAYKNQAPFSELYERAGKNMDLAKKWMADEQQAVDDAMKAYQDALAKANAIYDNEVIPCRRGCSFVH